MHPEDRDYVNFGNHTFLRSHSKLARGKIVELPKVCCRREVSKFTPGNADNFTPGSRERGNSNSKGVSPRKIYLLRLYCVATAVVETSSKDQCRSLPSKFDFSL